MAHERRVLHLLAGIFLIPCYRNELCRGGHACPRQASDQRDRIVLAVASANAELRCDMQVGWYFVRFKFYTFSLFFFVSRSLLFSVHAQAVQVSQQLSSLVYSTTLVQPQRRRQASRSSARLSTQSRTVSQHTQYMTSRFVRASRQSRHTAYSRH